MSARYWVGGTGTWDNADTTHWSATSGGAGGQSVPGASDDVILDANSGGGTVTPNYNFSVVSVTMGAFTGKLDFNANTVSPTVQTFSLTGTGARTFLAGVGTITCTGTGTPWDLTTTTNGTFSMATCTIILRGANTTFAGSAQSYGSLQRTGGGTMVQGGTNGSTFVTLTVIGVGAGDSIAMNTGTTVTGTCSLTGASAVNTLLIKSNSAGTTCVLTAGVLVPQNCVWNDISLTINSALGGTTVLGENLNLASTSTNSTALILTQGGFNANNYNVTCSTFASSNTNTRTLAMGSGTWTLTGGNATVWNLTTITNMTLNVGTSTLNLTYSGSTGTRNISNNFASTAFGLYDVNISAGSDAVAFITTGPRVHSLNFTGYTGAFSATTAIALMGDLTLGSGMTQANGSGTFFFWGTSGTQTITSNSVVINNVTINGIGGTVTLADALNLHTSRTLTLTNGTFNDNNKAVTIGSLSASNANIRTLTKGTGLWTLTGTGTVWDTANTTNLTFTDAGTTKITDTSNTAITFSGDSLTYNNLWFARGASTASNTLVGNTTFADIKDTGTVAHSLLFTAGSTVTVNTWHVSGNPGALITVNSTTTGTFNLVKATAGVVDANFLNIQHAVASPANTWYAGLNSVNNQSVATAGSGWLFTGASKGNTAKLYIGSGIIV